jgi:hypothetical protein
MSQPAKKVSGSEFGIRANSPAQPVEGHPDVYRLGESPWSDGRLVNGGKEKTCQVMHIGAMYYDLTLILYNGIMYPP